MKDAIDRAVAYGFIADKTPAELAAFYGVEPERVDSALARHGVQTERAAAQVRARASGAPA